jgi:hypothetical protein
VTLIVTLAHLDLFHLGAEVPLATRAVAWAWIAVYALVPALLIAGLLAQRRSSGLGRPAAATPTDDPPAATVPVPGHVGPALPGLVRATLVALAALLVGLGVALLVAPTWADGAWPWTLTPLTARAVGAWLLGLGTAAAHARLLDDVAAIRPLAATGVTFGVLQAAALVRHGDELSRGTVRTVAYVATIATLTAVSAWVLRRRR